MSRYMDQLACRYHPGAELIEDYRAGDMICPMCGRVVGERMIDVGSEWRDFGNESDSVSRSRVGAAQSLLYDDDFFQTTTTKPSVKNNKQVDNEPVKLKQNTNISPISSENKALRNGHEAIRIVASRVHLTRNVVDRAFITFKECYQKQCLRGHSQDAIVATCIYIACRAEGSARMMKEICSITAISVKEIGRCLNKVKRALPDLVVSQAVDIKALVPRFCNDLELEQEKLIRKTAIHIAQTAQELCDIQGRQPSTIAGASIYLACAAVKENKTKKDIQVSTGASEAAITEVYKIMLPYAGQLFPKDFVFQCSLDTLPRA